MEILKALWKSDFYPTRQTESHIIVEDGVMDYGLLFLEKKELGKGLILSIISDYGLTKKEFLKLL